MTRAEIIAWLRDIFPDKLTELDATKIADEWLRDKEAAESESYDDGHSDGYDEGYNDGKAECED